MTRVVKSIIAIGADHAGFPLKQTLADHLRARGHEVVDFGTHSEAAVDYPDFAAQVAAAVGAGRAQRGILVCGSAIGMAIAANRHRGVRAAVLRDPLDARMSREHNDANVACLGGRVTPAEAAKQLVDMWLDTAFAGGRHARRVEKIDPKENG